MILVMSEIGSKFILTMFIAFAVQEALTLTDEPANTPASTLSPSLTHAPAPNPVAAVAAKNSSDCAKSSRNSYITASVVALIVFSCLLAHALVTQEGPDLLPPQPRQQRPHPLPPTQSPSPPTQSPSPPTQSRSPPQLAQEQQQLDTGYIYVSTSPPQGACEREHLATSVGKGVLKWVGVPLYFFFLVLFMASLKLNRGVCEDVVGPLFCQ